MDRMDVRTEQNNCQSVREEKDEVNIGKELVREKNGEMGYVQTELLGGGSNDQKSGEQKGINDTDEVMELHNVDMMAGSCSGRINLENHVMTCEGVNAEPLRQDEHIGVANYEKNLKEIKASTSEGRQIEVPSGELMGNSLSEQEDLQDPKMDLANVDTKPVEHNEIVGAGNEKPEESRDISVGAELMEKDAVVALILEQRSGKTENFTLQSSPENLEARPKEEVSEVQSGVENSEMPSVEGSAHATIGNVGQTPGGVFGITDLGQLEPVLKYADDVASHLSAGYEVTPALSRKRKSTTKTRVTSTWVLRPKSQEKPKALESNETPAEDAAHVQRKRRRRKKKGSKEIPENVYSRIRKNLKYFLQRIHYEQNLIDAYSAEGWKKQSVDKLKPEKELQRAKSKIISYKLKIRELFRSLDELLAVGKLPESLFDSEGEIDSEDIFCGKCGSKDLPADNDIILCDGSCERGFHQLCLNPPLLKEDIPPDDEGWLCPGCDCKVDCIDLLNELQGTNLSVLDKWEKIFPEAAAAASGKKIEDDSSDDSEDDDFNPDKPDTDDNASDSESSSDDSDYFTASDKSEASLTKEQIKALSSDDSEDENYDPEAPDLDEEVRPESSSSDFTSDSEDLGAVLQDDMSPGKDGDCISQTSDYMRPAADSHGKELKLGQKKKQTLQDELSFLLETNSTSVSGKRNVEKLDYKTLHDETYGNTSSDPSDEDFEGHTARKRRKISENKTPLFPDNPLTTENRIDVKYETDYGPATTSEKHTGEGKSTLPAKLGSNGQGVSRRTCRKNVDGRLDNSPLEAGSGKKTGNRRLREDVKKRLLESFKQNQYPERSVKENLAKELGIATQQVSKWFENARWSFNHRPQMASNAAGASSNKGTHLTKSNEKPELKSTVNACTNGNVEFQQSETKPLGKDCHGSDVSVGTPAEISGRQSRKLTSKNGNLGRASGQIHILSVDKTPESNTPDDKSSSQVRRSGRIQTRSSKDVN